jgi:hypothetical protein
MRDASETLRRQAQEIRDRLVGQPMAMLTREEIVVLAVVEHLISALEESTAFRTRLLTLEERCSALERRPLPEQPPD